MENTITYDDFAKLKLRVGTVTEAKRIEGSDKLLCLQVSLGDESRQIIAGIDIKYSPDDIVNKQIIIIINLEPRKLMGYESQGMLLAASDDSGPIILSPNSPVPDGSEVR